jgi:hypothetical protein
LTTLGDAVYRLITGHAPKPEGDWLDMRRELVTHYGSYTAAARAAGIPRRTWGYWVTKEQRGGAFRRGPLRSTLDKLRAAVRAARVDRPQSNDAVKLKTKDRATDRERDLTNANLKLKTGAMQRVADVYAATGDQEAAAQQFIREITVEFYRDYLRPRPEELDDEHEDEEDEEDEDEEDDEEGNQYPEWYDDADLAYEGAMAAGDSDTYSGGLVASVG